tara:strand:- start:1112 stop:1456 length:345 start_codon:yes stop_codon:yes gene_type:complete
MAFKLGEAPYSIDGPSVLFKDLGQGILGEANKNGTININSKLDPEFVEEVLDHEEVHINQIRRGDLTYDDGNIYWKGRKFNKNSGIVMEGKNTPWEKQAYEESNTQHGSKKYNI